MFIVVHKANIILTVLILCMCLLIWQLYPKGDIAASVSLTDKLVVIDPGHGGVDGGCSGSSGILEKELNLKIALKLAEHLKETGISYIMTRETDVSIHDSDKKSIRAKKRSDLQNRRSLVEESGCSLYISIHMNQFEQSKYRGAQVFYSNLNTHSRELAQLAQKSLLEELQDGNTRKPKKAGDDIYLLKYTKMPAILVECGFLSNQEEESLLITDAYQDRIAKALCQTIIKWYEKAKTLN